MPDSPIGFARPGSEPAVIAAAPLRTALESILARYAEVRQTEPFGRTIQLWPPFEDAQAALATRLVVAYPTMRVVWSVGQGKWAKVPWLAILDERETRSIQHGLYCGLLFRQDLSGVYVALAQGIADPQARLGRARAREVLRTRAAELREQYPSLADAGFTLNDAIDLRVDAGLAAEYRDSIVAYTLYEAGAVPDDDLIVNAVGAVLRAYDDHLRSGASPSTRSPRAWLVPPSPRAYSRTAPRRTVVREPAATVRVLPATDRQEPSVEPRAAPDLAAVAREFGAALAASRVTFGARHADVVRTFVASLAARRLLVLAGLSGSGKTAVAVRFGQWLGEGRMLVLPVRPDWSGPEPLLGYEDALQPAAAGRRAWHVPDALAFMLRAARDPGAPYLLLLDEMNLAHVERYLADVLSGMESGAPCLPNLALDADGRWRPAVRGPAKLEVPDNLFIVGTINVDDTTHALSPKVLDRANVLEFRVGAAELPAEARKPVPCAAGSPALVGGFLEVARDDAWHVAHPTPSAAHTADRLRALHSLLAEWGLEFGHRAFHDGVRLATMLAAAGESSGDRALDAVVMQKILPRLHGSRRRLEAPLVALACFCVDPSGAPPPARVPRDELPAVSAGPARLPRSLDKIERMLRSLRADQFASFAG